VTRFGQDGIHGITVQSTEPDLSEQLRPGVLGGQRGPVRPGLDHRVIRVCGGQDPGGGRQGLSCETPVIAGTVHAFVVLRSQRADAPQWLGSGQHPVGVVGMQANLFPLPLRQRTLFSPEPGGDTDSPDVVKEAGPAQ
jgi:hypothetical protein